MLQSFSDYYREGMKKLLKEDLYHQIFDKLDDLIETNLRIRLLLKEEYDKKGHNAPIGQIFLDLSSDFNNLQYSVDNFLSISTSFQTEYYGNKSFRKRVKSLQRRSNNRFMKYIKLPLEGIVNYVQKLTEISKVTPNWHPDYEPINSVLKILTPVSIKAEQNLKEEKRRITLIKIQRKIKGAPNLADDVNCTFVGKWKLMKDKMFIFVFSDLIIIVQEKTELLSRRQYYAIQKQIEVKSIGEVKMEKSGIVLKIKSRKIEIKVQMKKKELYDAIMQQKLKVQTVE
ncbi:rho guanine nucleotide exchange factor 39 [Histomonas meleagridis]|uniref:rho guanine nucleotide exchange factor 39 n=1 Tax=Histomonas meleagridis TaxID=135588 RepID=UPI0035599353|nr:rho guanine nucleotide exchange factor 39 [Histomonas meleagridis]KAH0802085.1 rho guanine nucleotide exchange factor 39 [Histomonas meleagridis]